MVRLRLLDAGEYFEDVVYATLSHCRVGGPPIRLSTDSYASSKRMTSFADLPRTFQEAVYVTISLGISYTCIDALCTIQDSKEDWAREAALMDEVYANALVNLAAAASSVTRDAGNGISGDCSDYTSSRGSPKRVLSGAGMRGHGCVSTQLAIKNESLTLLFDTREPWKLHGIHLERSPKELLPD